MKFSELVQQASALLKTKGRVSYRMLQREFGLDDETLEDLKTELIEVDELATDKDGKMLIWVGQSSSASRVQSLESKTEHSPDTRRETLDPRPISYTPQHLADRILAEQAAMESRGAADGERKTITALFATSKAQPP